MAKREDGFPVGALMIGAVALFFIGRREAGGSYVQGATMTQAQLTTYNALMTGALLLGILTNGNAALSDGSVILPDGTLIDPTQGV